MTRGRHKPKRGATPTVRGQTRQGAGGASKVAEATTVAEEERRKRRPLARSLPDEIVDAPHGRPSRQRTSPMLAPRRSPTWRPITHLAPPPTAQTRRNGAARARRPSSCASGCGRRLRSSAAPARGMRTRPLRRPQAPKPRKGRARGSSARLTSQLQARARAHLPSSCLQHASRNICALEPQPAHRHLSQHPLQERQSCEPHRELGESGHHTRGGG